MNLRIDAYAAGLLDGEGFVGLDVGRKGSSYAVRVDFGMTEKASSVLYRMQKVYGGNVASGRDATEKWDAVLTWRMHGNVASDFLRRVQPYLILKVEQARLALELQGIRDGLPQTPTGRAQWSQDALHRAAVIFAEMKRLNRKGPKASSTPPPGGRLIAQLVDGEWMGLQSDLFTETGLAPLSENLPQWGMTLGGELYELPTPERPTVGLASSSLPTPVARDHKDAAFPPRLFTEPDRNELAKTVALANHLLPTPVADHSRGLAQPGTDFQSLPNAVMLLPTTTVMDMGANYTPEQWAAWKAEQKANHGNGNGHGASLTQEAISLLPTPRAQNGEERNAKPYHRYRDGKLWALNLENATALIVDPTLQNLPSTGASTPPPSGDGSPSSDDDPQPQLFPEPTDDPASAPLSSSSSWACPPVTSPATGCAPRRS